MGLTRACVLLRVFPACGSNPCQNDGTCRLISSTGQEVCSCRHGYSGPHCSVGEWGVVMRCVCVCVRVWGMPAGEDMSEQLKLHSAVFRFCRQCGRDFTEGLFQLDFRAAGGDLLRGFLFRTVCDCRVWGVGVAVGGWCACRSGLGVLWRQGRRLQRGGEHHGLRRAVSAVELGPAVWRAPRGHRGRLASQRPRGSRLLQVRPRLTSHPASADVATRGTWS